MHIEWIDHGTGLHLLGFDRHLLAAVLVTAGLVSTVLIAFALAAFARRRSWSYLLVTLALATLSVRTVVGLLTLNDLLGSTSHHILEHGLDTLAVLLLLGAVYSARTIDRMEGRLYE